MRLLGIDYGTRNVGLALSNEEGTMAFPHSVLSNDGDLITHISTLVHQENVETIVIGQSHNLSGEPNVVQKDINTFVDALKEHIALPVVLEPEYFSTQEALRIQGRTDKTDASAAALILERYIAKQH